MPVPRRIYPANLYKSIFLIVSTVALLLSGCNKVEEDYPVNFVLGDLVELNDNGAWSWFMDERAIVHDNVLYVGSVRAIGKKRENLENPNSGNVEVSTYGFDTGEIRNYVLHKHLEQDDHDAPGFIVRPDNRILAVYSKHSGERKLYYRITEPGSPYEWGETYEFITPGVYKKYGGDNVTYTNLFYLPDGYLYNFYRGYHHEPNYIFSENNGETWAYGGRFLKGKGGYSPYLKYAQDQSGQIHFIATEDHPREYDNSVYHGVLTGEGIFSSDGQKIADLSNTVETSTPVWELTKVYQGGPDNVAWIIDIEIDQSGNPYVLYSVQMNDKGTPRGKAGQDIRYHFGQWTGSEWVTQELAFAGSRLYPKEDDYSGLGALDPYNKNVVYISTNSDPVTGQPLTSRADNTRHYELFRGKYNTTEKNWEWSPVTRNSDTDNLRPLVPKWRDDKTALIWMRGAYLDNGGEWSTRVVMTVVDQDRRTQKILN